MNDDKYDYEEAVRQDVREYLEEHAEGRIGGRERDRLFDDMFVSDSVTGNASGSYTCNAWKAEGYLCHNEDLREECAEEFCIDAYAGAGRGAEYWDVSIRCMMLGRVLDGEIEKWNDEHEEEDDDNEEE